MKANGCVGWSGTVHLGMGLIATVCVQDGWIQVVSALRKRHLAIQPFVAFIPLRKRKRTDFRSPLGMTSSLVTQIRILGQKSCANDSRKTLVLIEPETCSCIPVVMVILVSVYARPSVTRELTQRSQSLHIKQHPLPPRSDSFRVAVVPLASDHYS